MKEREVHTQTELAAALKAGDYPVLVGDEWFDIYGSAQVTAYDSAQVRACGSVQVTAGKCVAVAKHGRDVKVGGGVLIEPQAPKAAAEWCEAYGVKVRRGVAYLFKGLNEDFTSPHGTSYKPGTCPVAPDWDGGARECGGGLHFCPSPGHALRFYAEAKRFVRCPVRLSEIVVHPNAGSPDKVKAPRVCGHIVEVDIMGNPVKE